jgi:hypothetical protein
MVTSLYKIIQLHPSPKGLLHSGISSPSVKQGRSWRRQGRQPVWRHLHILEVTGLGEVVLYVPLLSLVSSQLTAQGISLWSTQLCLV